MGILPPFQSQVILSQGGDIPLICLLKNTLSGFFTFNKTVTWRKQASEMESRSEGATSVAQPGYFLGNFGMSEHSK